MRSFNVLGIHVHSVNIPSTIAIIDGWIKRQEPHYVCITGVHGIMECQGDPALKRVYQQAGLVTPDGMPLVWLGKWAGHQEISRVYGPDLLLALCAQSQSADPDKQYKHFFYGGNEGVAQQLARNLQANYPHLQVVGCYTPPFRPLTTAEEADLSQQIQQSQADIVWVGLGAPKQEKWMADHVGTIGAPVLIGIGAAFDFHSGRKAQAPLWMQRNGLEWLFRLMSEPKRLWRRYLINNPLFIAKVCAQKLGLNRYPD